MSDLEESVESETLKEVLHKVNDKINIEEKLVETKKDIKGHLKVGQRETKNTLEELKVDIDNTKEVVLLAIEEVIEETDQTLKTKNQEVQDKIIENTKLVQDTIHKEFDTLNWILSGLIIISLSVNIYFLQEVKTDNQIIKTKLNIIEKKLK